MNVMPHEGNSAIGVDDRGQLNYASAAESGHVEIELPALPGAPNETERLLAKDFGQHVIGKIEASFNRQGYLTSGAQQTPPQVFRHYCAVARGAGLMDAGAIRRMEGLAKEFEEAGEDEREFFRRVVKDYLGALSPKRRQS